MFFCEKDESEMKLHQCQTFPVHQKIKEIAEETHDTKTLAKLSEGDMIAVEAKYHCKCLASYYNRGRHDSFTSSDMQHDIRITCGIALSEVITSLETRIEDQTQIPVFLMKDIKKHYQYQLRYLQAPEHVIENVHVTRLKNEILKRIPGLCEQKNGKFVILTLDGENGRALFKASQDSITDEGMILSKAAKIIRKSLFQDREKFNGDFSFEKQKSSVSKELLNLVSLILDDNSQPNITGNCTQTEVIKVNLTQLIQYNSVKKTRQSVGLVRHLKSNEPPLPIKIGLLIHAATRKKSLINKLAADGLSINYQRVQEIQSDITKYLCAQYNQEGVVCPPQLEKGLFTVTAIDNIDHNPSSTTACSSFHGTTISVFQKTKNDQDKKINIDLNIDNVEEDSKALPVYYTNIFPTRGGKPDYPTNPNLHNLYAQNDNNSLDAASAWLKTVNDQDIRGFMENPCNLSFSSFYSQTLEKNCHEPDINVLLPILNESINSPSVVNHCMKIVEKLTNYLNPNQTSVMIADQPVYTIAKQLQWQHPKRFDQLFIMLGPLHIEMAFMSAIGDWVLESGWTDIFKKANISTVGRVESFLAGNKVKRTRYAHQISLVSLVSLATQAFKSQVQIDMFENWKKQLCSKSPTATFWFTLIEMETLLMMLVRSIRESNFELFISCLRDILPWMFALDHIHYARWLTVHVADLLSLEEQNNTLFNEMMSGFFTISKSKRNFSSIAIDQAHEQNNKLVKIDGGAIGILENESALLNWTVAGPMISDMLKNVESLNKNTNEFFDHHEDTESFQKKFISDKNAFIDALVELGNPFLEEEDNLIHLITKQLLSEKASESVKHAKETGNKQLEVFVKERFIEGTSSIYETIRKNNLLLYRQRNSFTSPKSKQKVASLSSDCRLYSNLYIASQSREGNLEEFFSHENHAYPVSLSEYGKLRKCSAKSDFLKCLDEIVSAQYEEPAVQMKVVDGAAFVNIFQPKVSKTFGEYCYNELVKKVSLLAHDVDRIDFVFDTYIPNSLKTQTRDNRGTGIRVSVRKDTPICKNFQNFLRNSENKTELFLMIAKALSQMNVQTSILATAQEDIISNGIDTQFEDIMPCNQEEADTRLFLHVFDAFKKGFQRISILTVDTDVVIIALYHFYDFLMAELWIEFGVGQYKRWLPIHKYAEYLGEEKCRALPFWYALTGCDTVSMFSGRGKKTAWKVWGVFEEATRSFVRNQSFDLHYKSVQGFLWWKIIRASTSTINQEDLKIIERFVILLYDRTSVCTSINQCRRELFTKKGRTVENIPPTLDALKLHIKRASLQSRIWCDSKSKLLPEFNLREWIWETDETGAVKPVWMKLPEASLACKELIKCKCKANCLKRCRCKLQNLKCTELCGCGGGCDIEEQC